MILMRMKVQLSRLRRIIREALVDKMRLPRGPNTRNDEDDRSLDNAMSDSDNIEEVYVNPRHARGIGPEVDIDQKWGKISSTEAMVRYPDAVNKLIKQTLDNLDPVEIIDVFGSERPYPKDVADIYAFRLKDGKLTAIGEAGWDYQGVWDQASNEWTMID